MAAAGNERARLDSWKEIAEYLGRDVRTVVRWEKEKGLPIHTVPGLRRRSVFAYKDELDAWLAGSSQINGETNGALSDAGEAPPLGAHDDELSGEPVTSWRSFLRQWPPRYKLLIFGGAGLMALLVLTFLLVLIRSNIAASSVVDRVTREDNKIVVWNKSGERNWEYEIPPDSRQFDEVGLLSLLNEDLGGEYLVYLMKRKGNPDVYWLFSSRGRLLWRYAAEDVLQFGKESYPPPWTVRAAHRPPSKSGKTVLVALAHNTWWPSIVVLLDAQGRPMRKFVNSGWVTSLYSFDGRNGPLLAAGGASNAHNAAMLAILDLEQFAGSSPEEKGSPYECLNCPPGRPLNYFVFPRSELNIATGSTFNFAFAGMQGDRLIVQTMEEELSPTEPTVAAFYEFSPDLKLLRASYGNRYWDLHRKLEVEGRIMHSQAECPDRNGPRTVLSWDPQNGWKELHPN